MKLPEKNTDRKIYLNKDDESEQIYNYCGAPTLLNNLGFTCFMLHDKTSYQMIWEADLLHRS